jgi:hypothetical protein
MEGHFKEIRSPPVQAGKLLFFENEKELKELTLGALPYEREYEQKDLG